MKNLKKAIVAGILFSLVLFSCQKDENAESPDYYLPLVGSWKVEKGLTDADYMIIEQDRYCYKLFTHQYNFRSVETDIIQVTKGQVLFDGSGLYNFRFSKDTLYLTSPGDSIALVKTESAPAASDWVTDINVSVTYAVPVQVSTDIAFDEGNIWFGNGYAGNYLYKINLLNGAFDSIPVTIYAWAVERDNNGLWVSSDGNSSIFKINKSTGVTFFTSTDMGAWIYGIAWDGQHFWCYSNNENTLYEYNPLSDHIVSTLTFDNYMNINGMTYDGGFLYICYNGSLAKCSLSPFNVTDTYELKGYYLYGITFDGTSFWANAYNNLTEKYEIVKLEF